MEELDNTNVRHITTLAITVIFQASFVAIIAHWKVLLAVILYLMMVHRTVIDFSFDARLIPVQLKVHEKQAENEALKPATLFT